MSANNMQNVRQTAQMPLENEEKEIDLLGLFYRLIEKAKYIVIASVLVALIAGIYTFNFVTPLYTATSKIYVMNSDSAGINLSDFQIGSYLTNDYKEVFNNWHVHEKVISELKLPYSYKQLSKMLSISNPSDTRIMYITVSSPDPVEAKSIADTYAKVAQEFITVTMDTRAPSLFEEALLPSAPSSPSKTKNIMIGFLLGFVLSCGIITVLYITDDKIKSTDDMEKYLNLPALGIMPYTQTQEKTKSKKTQSEKKK